jgi:hypothetical protein
MGDLFDKSMKAFDRETELPFGRLAGAILRDPKFPDPVVPPDLHLVKPAAVDADGNVRCIYCGRAVKWEAAQMVGSTGFECGTCQHANNWQEPVALDTNLKGKKWPWIVAGVLGAAAIVGAWQFMAMKDRQELAREYPIAATDEDEALFDKHVDRWDVVKVAAALDSPPAFKTLALGAACDRSIQGAYEHRSDREKSRDDVRRDLQLLVESAERGRFYNEFHRFATVMQIAGPVLSIRLHDGDKPRVLRSEQDPDHAYFQPGTRAGTAYLYDLDGTLLCAGAFEAESSPQVEYTKYSWKGTPDDEQKKFTAEDQRSADDSLDADLDKQMTAAIAAALKKVN